MKSIRLSDHAQQQLLFRGCSAAEVTEAIQTSAWEPAELGRLQCRRNFRFDEPEEIVVVTVYVYYFSGERR